MVIIVIMGASIALVVGTLFFVKRKSSDESK